MNARHAPGDGEATRGATVHCRVERWRGYTSSTFFVRTPAGEIFESRPFRWRKAAPPPDDGGARAAYDELVRRLADLGWVQVGRGDDWYAAELTNPSAAPPEPALPRVVAAPQPQLQPQPQPQPQPPAQPQPRIAVRPPEPEPGPPPATPAEPARAPMPARRRLSRRRTLAGGLAAAAVAGGGVALLAGHDHPSAQAQTPARTAQALPRTAKHAKTTAAAPPPAAQPRRTVAVTISAVGNGSWLEVRRGSSGGTVLYSGTLGAGRTLHFRAPRLWGRFGAAANLRITQNGRAVRLQGTYDKLFRP